MQVLTSKLVEERIDDAIINFVALENTKAASGFSGGPPSISAKREGPSQWFHPKGDFGELAFHQHGEARLQNLSHGKGLRNVGNTCFLNSAIQALMYCPPILQDALESKHQKSCERNAQNLVCGFCEFEKFVVLAVTNRSGTMRVTFLKLLEKEILRKNKMVIGLQHCANELLNLLMQWLRKYELPISYEKLYETNKIKQVDLSTTYLGQIFTVVSQNKRTCMTCKNVLTDPEYSHELIVYAERSNEPLLELIQHAFKPELLSQKNKVHCDKCKEQTDRLCERIIISLPHILILTIQRAPSKNPWKNAAVSNVEKFSLQNEEFMVFGGIVHSGHDHFAHYVAVCQGVDGNFYLYSDERVRQLTKDVALKMFSQAFVLFFKKTTKEKLADAQLEEPTVFLENASLVYSLNVHHRQREKENKENTKRYFEWRGKKIRSDAIVKALKKKSSSNHHKLKRSQSMSHPKVKIIQHTSSQAMQTEECGATLEVQQSRSIETHSSQKSSSPSSKRALSPPSQRASSPPSSKMTLTEYLNSTFIPSELIPTPLNAYRSSEDMEVDEGKIKKVKKTMTKTVVAQSTSEILNKDKFDKIQKLMRRQN